MKTCQYCGFRSVRWMDHNSQGWYCRAEIKCFNRLHCKKIAAESLIKRMRHVGAQMANMSFNLSQQSGRYLGDDICRTLEQLRRDWDQAVRP